MAPKRRIRQQGAPQAPKKLKTTDNDVSNAQEDEHKTAGDDLRDQIFGTTEILEAILEHLPGKALFGVQRVSKVFQATILGSTRIQHKLFLRINNKAEVPWVLRPDELSHSGFEHSGFEQASESDQNPVGRRRRLLTPVDLNPSLNHDYDRRRRALRHGTVSVYMGVERSSELNRRRRFTAQELGQLSIGAGFISDPHPNHIQVELCFTLGVRLPTRITVTSMVQNSVPLTIHALIAKALDQNGSIGIRWRGDGHVSNFHWMPTYAQTGVPRQVLANLERQSGLQIFFRFSEFSFHLHGAVAPTDEERAAVARLNEENA